MLSITTGPFVAVRQSESVVEPVKIRRHHRDEIASMLFAVSLAELDGGDFCNGIPLICRLQRAGEQRFFRHRLRRKFWIDAGGAEREQLFDANPMRAADNIERNCQIVGDKIGWVSIVGVNAAD